jgi:pimeloyl-ACP methyl ester carboxylesterase
MKLYFISGLGADSRVFKHIQVPEGYEVVYLDWIPPVASESLSHYAYRLAESIDTKEAFGLVGLSMGGMIASEIAKIYHPVTTILLSSIPVNSSMPAYFNWAYKLRLHKLVPIRLLKSASIWKRGLAPDSAEDKHILRQVIRDTDPAFVRWAMGAILTWKNDSLPPNYWHIHGSRDEILPLKYTYPTHIIEGGNHLMIMNKAEELNRIMAEILPTPPSVDPAIS